MSRALPANIKQPSAGQIDQIEFYGVLCALDVKQQGEEI